MEDFGTWLTASGDYILIVCGIIGSIGAACTVLYKGFKRLISPLENLQNTIEALSSKQEHHDLCLARDKKDLESIHNDLRLILKCLLQYLTIAIDGNIHNEENVKHLKSIRDEVQQHIIQRETNS